MPPFKLPQLILFFSFGAVVILTSLGCSSSSNPLANQFSTWTGVLSSNPIMVVNSFYRSGDTVFAGTNYDGVYISTNNGSIWTKAGSPGQNSFNVNSITLSGSTVVAGTDAGVFLSTDNGSNWTRADSVIKGSCKSIYTAGSLLASGNNVFAQTDSGSYLSVNNGTTWISIVPDISNIKPFAMSGTGMFAVDNANYVYHSITGGVNWTKVGRISSYIEWIRGIATIGSTIFVGTGYNGVYRSTDNGVTWTNTSNGLPKDAANGEYPSINSLVVSGGNIFAGLNAGPGGSGGAGGVYISTDNGGSWNAVGGAGLVSNGGGNWSATSGPGLVGNGVYCLAVCGNNVIAGTQGGVFISTQNSGH